VARCRAQSFGKKWEGKNMKAEMWERFASKLTTPDDAPEPHRTAFLNIVQADDVIRLLVFGPANKTLGQIAPATLLAVTDKGWILVSGTDEEFVTSIRCNFSDTLLLELTVVLLLGRLKIDFSSEGGQQSAVIAFNTVMLHFYQEAIWLLLDGMEGITASVPVEDKQAAAVVGSLPMKFQHAVLEFKPASQHVMRVMNWLAVFGGRLLWFQQELSPEAMLVLTERELICISEEKAWSWLREGRVSKYGNIITYSPLARLASHCIQTNDRLMKLNLEIGTQRGGKTVTVEFPHEQKDKVESFMKQVGQQQSALDLPAKPAGKDEKLTPIHCR
jgi:hypothetical protein